jgi:transcriptional regulator with PAS, ATPase and Fis domain
VRVVAATQDLWQLVSKKLFRADLFCRLNVIPICLPPLWERVQDIPPLTEFFVAKFAACLNKPVDLIPDEVLAVLKAYDWPGNIGGRKLGIETRRSLGARPIRQLADEQCYTAASC